MIKKLQYIILAVIVLAVAGGYFFGGTMYKGSQTAALRMGGQASRNSGRFANGFANNNNFVSGNIIAKDAQSITIKTIDGSSKIIFYSNSAQVSKFVTGTPADIQVGQTVMASGKTNSDGSITAQSIQIRPAMPVNPINTTSQ